MDFNEIKNDDFQMVENKASASRVVDKSVAIDHGECDGAAKASAGEERISPAKTGREWRLETKSVRPVTVSLSGVPGTQPLSFAKDALSTFMRQGLSMEGIETKSLASVDPTGTAVMQDYVHDRIRGYLDVLSPLRSLASVMVVSGEGVDILIEKGYAEVGWVAETAQRDETKTPDIHKMHISTHEIYAKPKVTQKLLDDARIDLDSWILQKIAQQMAVVENQAFLNGDGNNKPRGILSYPMAKKAAWGVFESIDIGKSGLSKGNEMTEAILDAFHALSPRFLQNATWLMSRHALSLIRKLRDDKSGHFIWQPGLTAEAPSILMGHPVTIVDDMPSFDADKGGVMAIFGDVKAAYQVVDRTGLTVLRDPYSAKPYVEFYATRRVGGEVVSFDALKFLSIQ